MNTTATTNVSAWVEQKESIVISLLKKALRCIECETETIITISLFGACIAGVIVRLSQLSQYFNLISC